MKEMLLIILCQNLLTLSCVCYDILIILCQNFSNFLTLSCVHDNIIKWHFDDGDAPNCIHPAGRHFELFGWSSTNHQQVNGCLKQLINSFLDRVLLITLNPVKLEFFKLFPFLLSSDSVPKPVLMKHWSTFLFKFRLFNSNLCWAKIAKSLNEQ